MTAFYNEIDKYAAQWLRNLIAAGHIAPGVVDERDIRDIKPDELLGYTQCHFFAGIGGWSRALRLAGIPDDYPVWTGSCPCQPFSAAGKGEGFADERHLWPDFYHLISQCRPANILGEQVASKSTEPWIDLVHTDLEALGYAFGAVAIPSAGVGAPHIRDRTWWVADASNGERGGRAPDGRGQRDRQATGRDQDTGDVAGSGEVCGVAEPERERHDGSGAAGATPSAQCGRTATEGCGDVDPDGLPGPLHGFWRDADWLLCRDGKWRPVEPGTFPLVARLPEDMGCLRPGEISPYRTIKDEQGKSIGQAPWRVGMLRAYGNAINPYCAAQFIRTAMT